MRRVVLESPFGADPNRFIPYGRACVAHSLSLGEAPIAMHLLYTQPGILDDRVDAERQQGIESAFSWYECADACVVYRNFGISRGMEAGMHLASQLGLPIELRELHPDQILRSWKYGEPFPDFRKLTASQMIDYADRRG